MSRGIAYAAPFRPGWRKTDMIPSWACAGSSGRLVGLLSAPVTGELFFFCTCCLSKAAARRRCCARLDTFRGTEETTRSLLLPNGPNETKSCNSRVHAHPIKTNVRCTYRSFLVSPPAAAAPLLPAIGLSPVSMNSRTFLLRSGHSIALLLGYCTNSARKPCPPPPAYAVVP